MTVNLDRNKHTGEVLPLAHIDVTLPLALCLGETSSFLSPLKRPRRNMSSLEMPDRGATRSAW